MRAKIRMLWLLAILACLPSKTRGDQPDTGTASHWKTEVQRLEENIERRLQDIKESLKRLGADTDGPRKPEASSTRGSGPDSPPSTDLRPSPPVLSGQQKMETIGTTRAPPDIYDFPRRLDPLGSPSAHIPAESDPGNRTSDQQHPVAKYGDLPSDGRGREGHRQELERSEPRTWALFDERDSFLSSQEFRPKFVREKMSVKDPQISEMARAARRQSFGRRSGLSDDASGGICQIGDEQGGACETGYRYRSFDGRCNNLKYPEWGSRATTYQRFMTPQYEDGYSVPRGAKYDEGTGYWSRLPSARKISTAVFRADNGSGGPNDTTLSHMFMQFGQFLNHDISAAHASDLSCCDRRLSGSLRCFNIDLSGDEFFANFSRKCMDFTRSDYACIKDSRWHEQINGVTAFIDGSAIYGSTDQKAQVLRDQTQGGLLKVCSHIKDFIPSRLDLGEQQPWSGLQGYHSEGPGVTGEEGLDQDFVAGDDRAQTQASLLSVHVLWVREHNRIARGIKEALKEYPVDEETLFQESRRLVVAQLQNVVFKEYLPLLLNDNTLNRHNLRARPETLYVHEVNPSIRNEFSTAAFRFGHSLVQDVFEGKDQPWRLGKFFGDVSFATKDAGQGVERELEGLCHQQMSKADRFISEELTNKLFNNKKVDNSSGKGFDLGAINIQRGRDHGIPAYNQVRQFIGLAPIDSMDSKPLEIGQQEWDALKATYENPDDIDLYPGGLSETPLPGGILGPTFALLIADQFKALKDGDRFFFTHSRGDSSAGLSLPLQRMILKRTLGDIICENTGIKELPDQVFKVTSPKRPCDDADRSRIDYSLIAQDIVASLGLLRKPDSAEPTEYSSPTQAFDEERYEVVSERTHRPLEPYESLVDEADPGAPLIPFVEDRGEMPRPLEMGPIPQQPQGSDPGADFDAWESKLGDHVAPNSLIKRRMRSDNAMAHEMARVARRRHYLRDRHLLAEEDDDGPTCPKSESPQCDPNVKYRSFDGVCNNLQSSGWGSAAASYARFLPPEYEDGVWVPRGASYHPDKGGYWSRLPSPRKISSLVFEGQNVSSQGHSHMFMQFGQFIAHDLTSVSKDDLGCCDPDIGSSRRCFSMNLDAAKACMEFTRSDHTCLKDPAWHEQINGATSYLDGSTVYGSSLEFALKLRGGDQRDQGQLKASRALANFLPARSHLEMPAGPFQSDDDLVAGDQRVQTQPSLVSMHVLWFREHNRIAKELKRAMGGSADDETLFQEARKLVIAQIQKIVYGEYLPLLFNQDTLNKHHLLLEEQSEYRHDVDATIRNEFSTAAFRFGHSTVQDVFEGQGQPWRLGKFFGDSSFATKDNGLGFEKELYGLCHQKMLSVDRFITKELTQKLFNNKNLPNDTIAPGHDLGAINIQRGRDHGIPSYNKVRRFLSLPEIVSMEDRPLEIDEPNWTALKRAYSSPDEIDLFPAGLSETPLQGGLLGPTFTFLVAEQFRMLKDGDRFFFTHSRGDNPSGIAPQLQSMIMKRSLSDIICDNTGLEAMHGNVFLAMSGDQNEMVPCNDPSRSELDFNLVTSHLLDGANSDKRQEMRPREGHMRSMEIIPNGTDQATTDKDPTPWGGPHSAQTPAKDGPEGLSYRVQEGSTKIGKVNLKLAGVNRTNGDIDIYVT